MPVEKRIDQLRRLVDELEAADDDLRQVAVDVGQGDPDQAVVVRGPSDPLLSPSRRFLQANREITDLLRSWPSPEVPDDL